MIPIKPVQYLSRYTHRTAISNQRIIDANNGQIRFRYKDYQDHNRHKVMSLSSDEFIRRYLQHVLPKGLMRIRHYGFLSNPIRARRLAQIREILNQSQEELELADKEEHTFIGYPCPVCHQGKCIIIGEIPKRIEYG